MVHKSWLALIAYILKYVLHTDSTWYLQISSSFKKKEKHQQKYNNTKGYRDTI